MALAWGAVWPKSFLSFFLLWSAFRLQFSPFIFSQLQLSCIASLVPESFKFQHSRFAIITPCKCNASKISNDVKHIELRFVCSLWGNKIAFCSSVSLQLCLRKINPVYPCRNSKRTLAPYNRQPKEAARRLLHGRHCYQSLAFLPEMNCYILSLLPHCEASYATGSNNAAIKAQGQGGVWLESDCKRQE